MSLLDQYREETFIAMCESDYGLFRPGSFVDMSSPFPALSGYSLPLADLEVFGVPIRRTRAFGHGLSPKTAALKAFYEGLERIAFGFHPPDQIICNQSYLDMIEWADTPHPSEWCLCAKWQYDQKGFPLVPYSEDTILDWIEVEPAWQKSDKRTFVPLSLGHFYGKDGRKERLYFQTSNGCAFHWSYSKACESALLELIERDTFLLYWRCFMTGTNIKMHSIKSETLGKLWNGFQLKEDQFKLLFLKNEFNLPVVCTIFLGNGFIQPLSITTPGIAFHLEDAIARSLLEIYQLLSGNIPLKEKSQKALKENATDDLRVRSFSDHGIYYQDQENLYHLTTLYEKAPFMSLSEIEEILVDGPKNYNQLVTTIKEKKYDLMFKSFFTPELSKLGGYVVRAICPPIFPLDADHQTRALGGNRYTKISAQLGSNIIFEDSRQLNQKPHPID